MKVKNENEYFKKKMQENQSHMVDGFGINDESKFGLDKSFDSENF